MKLIPNDRAKVVECLCGCSIVIDLDDESCQCPDCAAVYYDLHEVEQDDR